MDRGISDEALMLRYRDGDTAAFEALYRRHRGPLYRYFLRQWRDRAAAEEMYQDVWTGVIRSRARYQPTAKFTTWLYRMAHNRLVDEYRRRHGRDPMSVDDPDGPPLDQVAADRAPDPAREVETRQQAARLLAALQALPEPQREVFLMHEEGGLTLEEIATATGAGFETAKSRLRYAVARLRQALGD